MAERVISLLNDKAISAQEAAQKLAEPSRAAFVKDGDLSKFEQELYDLWEAILSAAEQTPHDQQDKLVEVMHAIKNLPEPFYEGKKIVIWGQEQRWDQLPMLSAQSREELDIGRSGEAFVNVNAFFARLTAADVDVLNFHLYGLWMLREALEVPAETEIAQNTSPEQLKAAAVWLIYAAESLAKSSEQKEQFDDKLGVPGASLSAFKDEPGWKGFCQDRWETWKTRLASLKGAEVSADAQSLIDQALDKVAKV
ncbi:hypothetical protein ACHAPT_005375 [Fusarium lateritium]